MKPLSMMSVTKEGRLRLLGSWSGARTCVVTQGEQDRRHGRDQGGGFRAERGQACGLRAEKAKPSPLSQGSCRQASSGGAESQCAGAKEDDQT